MKTKRLLIVDDDPTTAMLARKVLDNAGFDVSTVGGGRDALDFMRNNRVDLLILDLMMPDMDGYQVIEAMQRDDACSKVMILVMSVLDEPEHILHALGLGARDYLAKPFQPVELVTRVEKVLQGHRASLPDGSEQATRERSMLRIPQQFFNALANVLEARGQQVDELQREQLIDSASPESREILRTLTRNLTALATGLRDLSHERLMTSANPEALEEFLHTFPLIILDNENPDADRPS